MCCAIKRSLFLAFGGRRRRTEFVPHFTGIDLQGAPDRPRFRLQSPSRRRARSNLGEHDMYPFHGRAEASRTIPTAPPDADSLGPNGRGGRHQGGVALMQHIFREWLIMPRGDPIPAYAIRRTCFSYPSIVTASDPRWRGWDIVGSRTPEIVTVQGRSSARLRGRQQQCPAALPSPGTSPDPG